MAIGKRPKVSCIVSCYNHERYIEQSIRSVLDQTFLDRELIVIDDGSKDRSVEIITRLAEEHCFTFIAQKNQGLSAAFNAAIARANGEYFAFNASDDYWDPRRLEREVPLLDADPELALVYGHAIEVDDKGRKFRRLGKIFEGHVFDDLFMDNFIPALTVTVRRTAFDETGGFDSDCYIEDYLMWLKVARRHRIKGVPEILAYYRITQNAISSNIPKMVQAQRQIANMFRDEPIFARGIHRCRARWFNALALRDKREAVRMLRSEFHARQLTTATFWKGLIKLMIHEGRMYDLLRGRLRPSG